ncbi:hypothetical protein [Streptomyces nitrosporeus]|uniref:DNA primase/polymerase bifunctional N-terminal domain-containing protein n=1 Tax=Streptomyces nitrosporeus TaxID=28894 RepID=A0A5J6FAG8_9ACTN|nr:hypothetical protein [Streptomyces nitrosporeus]QEU72045.1 hypothetical protein CP967_08725 [Streptomyces nitrosporeus]GGY81005.1 hypothetical protein GCM10010327_09550 [Streptomyces nitrosporeus]
MHATITAETWLAEADPDGGHAARWLRAARLVVLPLGRRWCAVMAPAHDGLAAAAGVQGPTIHDPVGRSVFFLVPVATPWADDLGTRLLGEGHWLTVPSPSVLEPPGSYWISPPDGSGLLVDPVRLHAALAARHSGGRS